MISGEQIRIDVLQTGPADLSQREWKYGLAMGLGNRYNITQHMKGTVQVLYNLLHDTQSPYERPLNIRIGFEVDFKKRTTKKDLIEKLREVRKRKDMLDDIKRNSTPRVKH